MTDTKDKPSPVAAMSSGDDREARATVALDSGDSGTRRDDGDLEREAGEHWVLDTMLLGASVDSLRSYKRGYIDAAKLRDERIAELEKEFSCAMEQTAAEALEQEHTIDARDETIAELRAEVERVGQLWKSSLVRCDEARRELHRTKPDRGIMGVSWNREDATRAERRRNRGEIDKLGNRVVELVGQLDEARRDSAVANRERNDAIRSQIAGMGNAVIRRDATASAYKRCAEVEVAGPQLDDENDSEEYRNGFIDGHSTAVHAYRAAVKAI